MILWGNLRDRFISYMKEPPMPGSIPIKINLTHFYSYAPIAHGDLEHEQTLIRKSVLKLLSGQSALKMDVASFPLNEEIAKAQVALQNSMTEAFAGKGAPNVIEIGRAHV